MAKYIKFIHHQYLSFVEIGDILNYLLKKIKETNNRLILENTKRTKIMDFFNFDVSSYRFSTF